MGHQSVDKGNGAGARQELRCSESVKTELVLDAAASIPELCLSFHMHLTTCSGFSICLTVTVVQVPLGED